VVGGSPCARVVHRREAGDVGTVLDHNQNLVLRCNRFALQFDLPE
jgi:hypothetical protein